MAIGLYNIIFFLLFLDKSDVKYNEKIPVVRGKRELGILV